MTILTIDAADFQLSQTRFGKMKVRAVIHLLEEDGWFLVKTKGSHRQFKHPTKPGKVTVSGKLTIDIPIGTLKSIWRQAQLQREEN